MDNSFSQTAPGIEWQKCLGGSSNDIGYSIYQLDDSKYIVSGFSSSNDSNVTGNHGSNDYWMAKLDSSGNLLWQKSFGGSLDELYPSIIVTQDSGFIMAGMSQSSDGDVTGNHGYYDYWIIKTDSVGDLQWQKNFGGSGDDAAGYIQQTADGGYIVSGLTSSFDGDVTFNHGNTEGWVIKLDTNGNIQWEKCYGGSDDEYLGAVQILSNGNYLIAGTTNSVDGDITNNHGLNDFWIAQIDASGNLVWQNCFGGSDDEIFYSMQKTSDNGCIVSGFTLSNDGDINGNHGNEDYWVIKVDSSGNLQWQKCLGGTNEDVASFAQQTQDYGYIIVGTTQSFNGDVSGNHGGTDYWVTKLDSAGNLKWQKCLGGNSLEFPYIINQTKDHGFVINGSANSNNGDINGNNGSDDYWIVKLGPDTITGITQLSNYPITITVSPNPLTTQSKLTFKNPGKEKFLFTLYDITGRITERVSTTNNEIILTKGSKQPGVYLFNLVNEKTGERWNGKIVMAE